MTDRYPLPADPHTLMQLLRMPRAGLITDIDGTIAPIAPTPDGARVNPEARHALIRLLPHLTLVAALTGRRATDGARVVDIPDLPVVGNHGMEMLANGILREDPDALPYTPHVARVIEALRVLPIPPGTILENKGPTASVHYRLAPDHAAARATLFALLAPLITVEGLHLTEGRALIEIRPPVPINKGFGLRRLCEMARLDAVVMLGDDLTDVDAFIALRDLRSAGRIAGLNIGVMGPDGTAHPDVLANVDVIAAGVPGVAALLTAVADAFDDDERLTKPESDAPDARRGGDGFH